jgi:hypothetical protein
MMFEAKDNSKIFYNFCSDTLMKCNSISGSIIGVDKDGNCKVLSTGSKNKWRLLSKFL